MLMELFSYSFGASVQLSITLVLPHVFNRIYNALLPIDPFFFIHFFKLMSRLKGKSCRSYASWYFNSDCASNCGLPASYVEQFRSTEIMRSEKPDPSDKVSHP